MDKPAGKMDFPRRISSGTYWMGGCLELTHKGVEIHSHVCTYLVVGETHSILVDTGHPKDWERVESSLDSILGDRPLDYVFPTHPEMPHAGNLARLLGKYPDLVACGDMRDFHLYYPECVDRMRAYERGSVLDLGGGYEFTLVEAVIHDLPNTLWGYEKKDEILFVSDGFSYTHYHHARECALLAEELGHPIEIEQAAYINGGALYWTRFVQVDHHFNAFEKLIREFPARFIAPAHGGVIGDVPAAMPVIRDAMRSARKLHFDRSRPSPAA